MRPFSTAFVRPDRVRFEFRSTFNGGEWDRYIVWASSKEVATWSDIRPGIGRDRSLALALAGATGVSGGSAYTVPSLLALDEMEPGRLTRLSDLEHLEDGKLGDIDCFRVRGQFIVHIDPEELERARERFQKLTGSSLGVPEEEPETLWIDKATFLLRRLDHQARFESFRTGETTIYDPAMELPIPEKNLRFDPPSGVSG